MDSNTNTELQHTPRTSSIDIDILTYLKTESTDEDDLNYDVKLTPLEQNPQKNDFTTQSKLQSPKTYEDDDLACLLRSWQLFDQLYVYLKGKKIDIECLKYLKERHIDQLFDELDEFNVKVIFEHKLELWQKSNGIYNFNPRPFDEQIKQLLVESRLNNIPTESPLSSTTPTSETKITVIDILKKTEQGRAIIQNYAVKQNITPHDRKHLVHRVVQHYTKSNTKMSVKKCKALAHEIVEAFPNENLSTYFTPGKNKMPPKGKLYDRYRGQRRSLNKLLPDEVVSKKKRN